MAANNHDYITLSPSALSRVLTCPGSLAFAPFTTDDSTRHADRGTALHLFVAKALEHVYVNKNRGKFNGVAAFKAAATHFPDLAVDECKDIARAMLRYVKATLGGKKPQNVFIEKRGSIRLNSHVRLEGTADLVIETADVVHVFDLKTGWLRVEVENNPQLLAYALLALVRPTKTKTKAKAKAVTLHIVQPAANNLAAWNVEKKTLTEFRGQLDDLAESVAKGRMQFQPSAAACRWCRHVAFCRYADKTLADSRQRFATTDSEDITQKLRLAKANAKRLRAVYDNAETAEIVAKAALASVVAMAKNGAPVDGMKLTAGVKRRSWADPDALVAMLRKWKIKDSDVYKKDLRTPKQLETLTGRDLSAYINVSVGSPRLIKGEATSDVQTQTARLLFNRYINLKED